MLTLKVQRRSLWYNIYTVWLFTSSDLKTVVYPTTVFAVSGALSGRVTTDTGASLFDVLVRIPHVLMFVWTNLLVEVIANQRLRSSILEDTINKPWRPLPSHRLTPAEALSALFYLIPIAVGVGFVYGCEKESLLIIGFSWMYNDLGGADHNFARNVLNVCGLLCFGVGATIVASGGYGITWTGYLWFGVLGAVILLTVPTQDFADMKGDAARGRKTLPLIYGENAARLFVATAVVVSSPVCSAFWHLGSFGYLLPAAVGLLVGYRITFLREIATDEVTWRLWCIWMSLLYMLPLFTD